MRLVILLLIGLQTATCCEVVALSVREALKRSEIVFRGSIAEIHDQEIVFRVERVWKGHIPAEFAMPKLIWRSTQCMPGFFEGYVKKGSELLVYARRMPEINESGYVPAAGSRTALAQDASDDFKKLGPGHPPRR